jgi:thiosulfate dehydrogenase [quinone] large subunit
MKKSSKIEIPEPKLSILLFEDTRLSFIWLIVRLYVGWQWFVAGFEKIQNPVWVGPNAGVALQGFLTEALAKTLGPQPDVQSWYATFLEGFVLPNSVFFSYLISFGEILVGAALILGLFTGIAAFLGAYMNMNYLLAGTVSINPILFILAVLLILSWRIAGWWGLDRLLLPLIGTPWKPGKLFRRKK